MSDRSAEKDAPWVSQVAPAGTVPNDSDSERQNDGDTEQRRCPEGNRKQRNCGDELGREAPLPEVQSKVSAPVGERRDDVRARLPVAGLRVRADHDSLRKAVRCTAGRSVGPASDAHRCGNYTRHPSGRCHLHRVTPPADSAEVSR